MADCEDGDDDEDEKQVAPRGRHRHCPSGQRAFGRVVWGANGHRLPDALFLEGSTCT